MLRLPTLSPALALSLAVLLPAPRPRAQGKVKIKDMIVKVNGQKIRNVEILKEGLLETTYKRRGKEAKVPTGEIEGIEWNPAPESYARALLAFERGDFYLAANLFSEAADQAGREALKAHASFRSGLSLARHAALQPNQAATASSVLRSWVSAHPDHKNLPDAQLALGEVQLLGGMTDEALKSFQDLESLVQAKSLDPAWIAKAKFGQARAFAAKKDFRRARSAYVAASSTLGTLDITKPDIADLLVKAKIGEGECYLEEGRFDEARSFFRRLRTSAASSNPAMETAALCGEAQALFRTGADKKDPAILRRAQILFARVSAADLLEGETAARARYFLAHTILLLGKEREGPDFSQRANQILESVAKGFPNNVWGLKAQAELKTAK